MHRVTGIGRPKHAVALLAIVVAVVVATPAVANAGTQYPVPYSFTAGVANAALHPGSPPPGANDWSCRPTAAHPRPVVLVHGLFANMSDNWQTTSPLLANNGYCVFALTYGVTSAPLVPGFEFGGLTTMEQSAGELSAFVDRVLAATGAHQVDIVGHSEGATMPDYYLEYLGGAAKVHRYVGIAGVKHGTTLHGIGTLAAELEALLPGGADPTAGSCDSCSEFLVGSDYIKAIEARAPVRSVTYTNVATRYDELVSPNANSVLTGPNVTNIVLQDSCALDFSDHLSIISSPRTSQIILNALDPAHARPVPCTLVAPAA